MRAHGVLIIFDEVMSGFGRTGTLFALEQAKRVPDILCLSKGLTGGFLPLSLTIVNQKIYNAFLGNHFSRAFAHGHSYTANPLGCAAALASLNLLLTTETQNKIKVITQIHQERLASLAKNFHTIAATRQIGTIAAFNLETEQTNYSHPIGNKIKKLFLQRGLLLRPLGNTIYLLPPYCISENDLLEAYDIIEDRIKHYKHLDSASQ